MTPMDLTYSLALGASSPAWLLLPSLRRKVLSAFRDRQVSDFQRDDRPVLVHGVSVGEVNAARSLVEALSPRVVVSSTTVTGYARLQELYGANPAVGVVRWPLDFSWQVSAFLDRVRPSMLVLMELEVWPGMVRACRKRGIPVVVANGRISDSSFRQYRLFRPVIAPSFKRLDLVLAQDSVNAQRFIRLGCPADRVKVTGTMKFDTAASGVSPDRVEDLRRQTGLTLGSPVWVCGGTGPGEESLVLDAYAKLLHEFPLLRLAIIPRKPDRFDEVAAEIARRGLGYTRRSGKPGATGTGPTIVLGDTMGELRAFYALADVVFVGRTLVDLGAKQHGSDMIEACALGKPVVVGPWTGNFAEPMRYFRDARAILEISSGEGLFSVTRGLLLSTSDASELGHRAMGVVELQRGATRRTLDIIKPLLAATSGATVGRA